MGSPTRKGKKPGEKEHESFGMYELLDRIAVGGMAEIHLAREAGTSISDEYLVVKRILPHFAIDRQLVDMFLDEQRVAATLTHDNIVRTYDVGEVDGEYFISMEYLQGEDVRRIFRTLKKRRMLMPLDLALAIIRGGASGLHYAHEKKGVNLKPLNIVHRDVTPHNLFVTYDGVVKLLDFGVAKAANRMIQTTTGTIKGKIPYMSPEQCKGSSLDRRSDIYALGVILYELTCGVRLYRATGLEFETMRRIVEEPAMPPSERRPDYPPQLERIVMKALSKSPHDRYQTAEEFSQGLDDFARNQGLEISQARLSRFMNELFSSDIEAFKQAAGDVTAIVGQLQAKKKERDDEVDSLPSGDFIYSMSASNPGIRAQMGETTGSGIRHIGASPSGSLQSVWGAADKSMSSHSGVSASYERLTRPARITGSQPVVAPVPADDKPVLEPEPQRVSRSARPSRPSASFPAFSSPLSLAAVSLPEANSAASQPQRSGAKSPGWRWIALIVLGMAIAFLLGVAI